MLEDVDFEKVHQRLCQYRGQEFSKDDVGVVLRDLNYDADCWSILQVLQDLRLAEPCLIPGMIGYPSNTTWKAIAKPRHGEYFAP